MSLVFSFSVAAEVTIRYDYHYTMTVLCCLALISKRKNPPITPAQRQRQVEPLGYRQMSQLPANGLRLAGLAE